MKTTIVTKKVSWSRSVKITTSIFLPLVCAADVFVLVMLLTSNEQVEQITNAFVVILLSASIYACYALSPRRVILTDTSFILRKGIGSVDIRLDNIAEMSSYQPKSGFSDVRTFGIGGVCGDIGKFYNKTIGSYTAYVGNFAQAFYIKTTTGKKYMFSCDDRDEFLIALKKQVEKEH